MKKTKSFGGRIGLLLSFLGIALLFGYAKAKDPTGNLNLSPFEKYISVYECMQNTSSSCPANYTITEDGWMNVTRSETEAFCKPNGCADHSVRVLTCIDLVMKGYNFANKASVEDINDTITHGCKWGFNGTTQITSSAGKMYESKAMIPFVSAVAAALLLITLHHINIM